MLTCREQKMRVDELEDEEGTTGVGVSAVPAGATDQQLVPEPQHATSKSNEPFMTSGAPAPASLTVSSLIPPALPSLMSVYISVSRLPPTIPFASAPTSISHSTAAPMTQAYHWPSAPVEEHNFVDFFTGVNYRANVNSPAVLG